MYNLKKKRMEAGLSQSQLAAKANVPIRLIHYYEAEAESAHRNINNAAVVVVLRLSKALGCQIEEILEVEDANLM